MCIAPAATAQVVALDWTGSRYVAESSSGFMTRVGGINSPPETRYNCLAFDPAAGLFVTMEQQYSLTTFGPIGESSLIWFDSGGNVQRRVPVTLPTGRTSNSAMSMVFLPGGTLIATMFGDSTLYRVNTLTGSLTPVQTLGGIALDMTLLPDGRIYASLRDDPIRLWRYTADAVTGRLTVVDSIPTPGINGFGYQALASLGDGRLLASSSGTTLLLDPAAGTSSVVGLGSPREVRGMVVIPTPAGGVLVVLGAGLGVGWRRRRG